MSWRRCCGQAQVNLGQLQLRLAFRSLGEPLGGGWAQVTDRGGVSTLYLSWYSLPHPPPQDQVPCQQTHPSSYKRERADRLQETPKTVSHRACSRKGPLSQPSPDGTGTYRTEKPWVPRGPHWLMECHWKATPERTFALPSVRPGQ